jgi:hypothetical protein
LNPTPFQFNGTPVGLNPTPFRLNRTPVRHPHRPRPQTARATPQALSASVGSILAVRSGESRIPPPDRPCHKFVLSSASAAFRLVMLWSASAVVS